MRVLRNMWVLKRTIPWRMDRVCAVVMVTACLTGGCEQQPLPSPGPASPTPKEAPSGAPALSSPQASPRREPLPPELKEIVRIIGQQRFEKARDLAREYLEKHPDDGRAFLMIGLSHQKEDNHGRARPYFEKALELSPDYYVTHHYFGTSLYLLGELEAAREQHERLRAADPNEADAPYGLGLISLEESNLDDARSYFQQAIALFAKLEKTNPRQFRGRQADLARCHARLADVYFARDEYGAARDELIASTTIAPGNISAFYTLSLVYRRLGQDALAAAALDRYETTKEAIIKQRRRKGP